MAPPTPNGDGGTGGKKVRAPKLWRACLPLILLVVPLAMHLVTIWLPDSWTYWVDLAAWIIAGAIVVWTMIRVGRYLRYRWLERRKKLFTERQDPRFLTSLKIEERIKNVQLILGGGRIGMSRLPWYGLLASSSQEAGAILAASGLTFPHGVGRGLRKSDDQPDRWHLANEAVFVDLSGGGLAGKANPEVELIYSCLAKQRPREPLSGLVLMLPVDELAGVDSEIRKKRLTAILEHLQRMQREMMLNFPVYLLITGLNRVPGFSDFISQIGPEKSAEILGWSEHRSVLNEFDRDTFRNSLAAFRESLGKLLLRLMRQTNSDILSGRLYMLQAEMRGLTASLQEAVEILFSPNRYRDPLPLRGVYMTGVGAEGPVVSFRPQGAPINPNAGQDLSQTEQTGEYLRDLFRQRILRETGLTSRPRSVVVRNYLIWATFILLGLATLAGGYWWTSANQDLLAKTLAGSQPVFAQTRALVGSGLHEEQALELGRELLALKSNADQPSWFMQTVGLYRWGYLYDSLGTTHRAVFQEFVLEPLLHRARAVFKNWAGHSSHQIFTAALAEYIRWSKPSGNGHRDFQIGPLLDLLGVPSPQNEECRSQFEAFMKEGGPQGVIELKGDRETVTLALQRLAGFLNPTAVEKDANHRVTDDAQWWVDFSRELGSLQRTYQVLLSQPMLGPDDPLEKALATYETLVGNVSDLLVQISELRQSVAYASQHNLSWVMNKEMCGKLSSAARGWDGVQDKAFEVQAAAEDYSRHIIMPMRRNLHLVQLLYGVPGSTWLGEMIATTFGDEGKNLDDPSFLVGPYVYRLIEAIGNYHIQMSNWSNRLEEWEDHLDRLESIDDQATTLRRDYLNLLVKENDVRKVHQELTILAGDQDANNPPGAKQAPPAAGKEDAAGATKNKAAAARMLGIPETGQKEIELMHKAMLNHFKWFKLNERVNQWMDVFTRIRRYRAARSWTELALHFNYGSKLVGDSTWREIKKKPVFDFDEPNLLIEPLTGFIRDWTRSLPRELSTLGSSDKDQATPPELADFVELNQSLMRFEQKSLPILRKAAQTFVSCVHSMSLAPHQAWSQIWDTQGDGAGGEQKVNWGALHALDKFTQDFRSQEGEGLEHIISPLAASEQMVRTAFSTAVWKEFTATWNAVMSKYEKQGFQVSFPFMPHAEKEAPLGDLMNFFQDLEALAEAFHLMPKVDDGKQPAGPPAATQGGQAVFPMAKRMIKDMQAGQRKRFLDLCLGFRSFIEGRSLEKPLVIKAAMVPGVVGHYVHWVRVAFADGTHYDLNVYGKPPVEIPVQGREGSVTFEGLDVNKIPTTAFTMTQGDLALLQLPYAFGVPQDLDRKHWLVEGRLPSIEEPGKMIPFQLNLLFNQGTPEPLFWPEKAQ